MNQARRWRGRGKKDRGGRECKTGTHVAAEPLVRENCSNSDLIFAQRRVAKGLLPLDAIWTLAAGLNAHRPGLPRLLNIYEYTGRAA